MELNADFSKRAAVHSAKIPWQPSPVLGVERRMLDRIGDEVARATSIVRYAPKSRFSPHAHEGGEEFLVLEGVFQDEQGSYPPGTYVRNPPQSRHTPGSEPGCVIFVKLWQFDLADRTPVVTDSNSLPFQTHRAGVKILPLFQDQHEDVRLEHWEPGARIFVAAPGGIELLVLSGDFQNSGETFAPLSWLRLPRGATLQATAGTGGCKVWVKSGHLAKPQAATKA
jgi:anti-sigma factor ChrR (cupin superfamily)